MACDEKAVAALQAQTGLPRPICRALALRGLTDPAAADRFLRPRLSDLSDPLRLPDAALAAERIWRAIRSRECILVYGDYDVDGLTGTAVLTQALRALGGDVRAGLPNRLEEGYGLSIEGLERALGGAEANLIVTVDCGSQSAAAIEWAAARSMDVVVTDHHELSGPPAQPLALVNPKLGEDPATRMLSGSAVAFKLCHAVLKKARQDGAAADMLPDLRGHLDLVSLGVVADVAPLRDENRILARHGLARIAETSRTGLAALKAAAGLRGRVDAWHVGFVLGPRLNAAGRLGEAETALELLMTSDPARADMLAARLEEANQTRRRIEAAVLAAAVAEAEKAVEAGALGLAVAGEDWHPGVLGLVASRLCRRYRRPAIVIGFDEDGRGRGSGRSMELFDLVQGLARCADHLLQFGGHEMAAGLALRREDFSAFRTAFETVCAEALAGRDLAAAVRLDAWLDWRDALDSGFAKALDDMRPFGEGNPAPVWGLRAVSVVNARVVGPGHLKFTVARGGRETCDAIAFGRDETALPAGPIDLAFTLERNDYFDPPRPQLRVEAIRPTAQG